jgi:hypothetical protein
MKKGVIPVKYWNHPLELGIIQNAAKYPSSRNDE